MIIFNIDLIELNCFLSAKNAALCKVNYFYCSFHRQICFVESMAFLIGYLATLVRQID